jgi:lysophospholipase L1-like esterase
MNVRNWGPKFLLLAVSFLIAFGIWEAYLRISDFHFDIVPDRVEFGWPDPITMNALYQPDPDLFWVQKEYQSTLDGMRATPPEIVFMGDSCTEFGQYPEKFMSVMASHFNDRNPSNEAVGVGGWTSYQGLQQLERDVLPLAPTIVTLYYGWNDHWIGFKVKDSEIRGIRNSSVPWLAGTRLWQLVFKLQMDARYAARGSSPLRVAPEEFRANLKRMVQLARGAGTVPVLLTAPSAHIEGMEPKVLGRRWVTDLSQLVPLHQRYVSIVREVALSEDAPLCDLAERFGRISAFDLRYRYFTQDGIHLTPEGDDLIARYMMNCFMANELLLDPWTGPVGDSS